MILVYATNQYVTENRNDLIREFAPDKVGFRTAQFFNNQCELCNRVIVVGDYPEIVAGYSERGVDVVVREPDGATMVFEPEPETEANNVQPEKAPRKKAAATKTAEETVDE